MLEVSGLVTARCTRMLQGPVFWESGLPVQPRQPVAYERAQWYIETADDGVKSTCEQGVPCPAP